MFSRLLLLLKLFLLTVLVFAVQKPLFLWFNRDATVSAMDYLSVVWHGLSLDMTTAAYVVSVPWLLLAVLPDGAALRAGLRTWLAVAGAVVGLVFVADASLYAFWHFKLDSSIFIYTDKPGESLASVSRGYVAARAAAVAAAAGLCVWLYWRAIPRQTSTTLAGRLAVLLAAPLLVVMMRGGVGKGTANVSRAYYCENQLLNHSAVNAVFNLMYSLGKTEDFASEYQFFSEEERAALMAGMYGVEADSTVAVLRTQRPDILLVVWEGCGMEVTRRSNCTPELMQLMEEGVNFTRCYANSFRTDRGQLSLMAGWPAIPLTSLMKIPQKCEHLPALPRRLLEAGWETTYWYGGDLGFTNTGGYMHQAGFRRTVGEGDMALEGRHRTEWGWRDGPVMELVADSMEAAGEQDGRRPFFYTLMTLSSHEPWDVPTHRIEGDKRLNAFNYTDECLGRLVRRLKASPLWQNLLLIVTADHGIYMDEGDDLASEKVTHIPMVWIGGAVNGHQCKDKLMNQSDLAATLLGQLGLEHGEFYWSRDVTDVGYKYPTAYNCYNESVAFCDSTGYTVVGLKSPYVANPDTNRVRRARAILQTSYKMIDEL